MITHYDLFAGIGGNSIALEEVFYDEKIKHIFCEWEKFPTEVLKKHWPDGEYWGDIWDLILHLEQMQSDSQTGESATQTKYENTGETTTTETPNASKLSHELGQKNAEKVNGDKYSTTTGGHVNVVESQSQGSSTSTTPTTTEILNERRMALLERMAASLKQASQIHTKHSATTATSRKEYTENVHTKVDTNPERPGRKGEGQNTTRQHEQSDRAWQDEELTILTGGFPCQPFSAAGKRKGTADSRYLWPEMFRVIQLTHPQWVVAENVRGLTNWSDGMVLEQVCTDLESEGYEVQPIIIPAVAVNAPHRRDRVWIIACHNSNSTSERRDDGRHNRKGRPVLLDEGATEESNTERNGRLSGYSTTNKADADARSARLEEERASITAERGGRSSRGYPDWSRNWQEVAFATCDDSMDDGLPRVMDGATISRAKWRQGSLKAYGNAIVPQVAMEIFKSIKEVKS